MGRGFHVLKLTPQGRYDIGCHARCCYAVSCMVLLFHTSRKAGVLPEENEVRERAWGMCDGFSEKDNLLFPDRFVHGKEPDVAFGDLCSHAAHVADDAVNLVILAFKEVETVLDAISAKGFEFFPEQGLLLGFRHVIGKHHEHGEKKACRWKCR